MRYLNTFKLSMKTVNNPNIYPYNVAKGKTFECFLFDAITVLYGDNASGKSTMLNIMANKLQLVGQEYATSNRYGMVPYFEEFIKECEFDLAEDEFGQVFRKLPKCSRYIKSEDILYEIKKIQQETILGEGYLYEHAKAGMSKQKREELKDSYEMSKQMEYMKFAQEKYSNGETTLQMLFDYLEPDGLYLLDEPEVSLSPSNQVLLALELNKMARFLNCQFIISTHSPFMLGTLDAKIYNLDKDELDVCRWYELENVKYFYEFFEKNRDKFC